MNQDKDKQIEKFTESQGEMRALTQKIPSGWPSWDYKKNSAL